MNARTLALEALQRIAAFDEHEYAGPAKFDALATIAAIAALESDTGEPVEEQLPPFGNKRAAAMAIYTPPFKYQHGYIFDAQQHMVADNGPICDGPSVEGAVASRVRGWGRIGYMPNAAELQDEVGQMMADALNAHYKAAPPPAVPQPSDWSEVCRLLNATNMARSVGLLVGTSNWGAFVCGAMGAQPSQAGAIGYISAEALAKLNDPEWQELRGTPVNLWTINNPPSRAQIPVYASNPTPRGYDKTEMNVFVQSLYDTKMAEGRHGHYETLFHVVHQAIKRLQPRQAPDMFWDADNPECYGNDIQEIISEYGPGEVVNIDCAKSLPSISVLVSADSDGEGLTYEVIAAAPGAPACE